MEQERDEDRVSLPLDPAVALKALLAVDPEATPSGTAGTHDEREPQVDRDDGTHLDD